MTGNDKLDRKGFIRTMGGAMLMSTPLMAVFSTVTGCGSASAFRNDELFTSRHFTEPDSFTSGVEGPAVDRDGNLYAVNYERQHTIGKVTPEGEASVFVELQNGSIANGIRFNSEGDMFLADYTNHNVLKVDMDSRAVSVFAHQPQMSQPNDLAIGSNDILYASDPNWSEGTGKLWRINTDGSTTLLRDNMGTTNGIEVSPDENKLYVYESGRDNATRRRGIWTYDLSPEGEISNRRLHIEFDEHGADGMRCDVDGNLYVARYGRGSVAIVSPEGDVIREIEMAGGTSISNLAFGGPDGCTVYVTVADMGNIQVFRTDRPGRSWRLYEERR
ncbi:MAG: SMP-30/gluconolactonase/LRE family protein [Balneolaceae bacterium]